MSMANISVLISTWRRTVIADETDECVTYIDGSRLCAPYRSKGQVFHGS